MSLLKILEEEQLKGNLNKFLLEERKKGHRVVVIIDEAQQLDPRVLEQLRLLSNLETPTEKLIQIVLIGQPELDNLLNRDEMRQLRQRITINWELLPLNQEEAWRYIEHRLNVALGKGKVKFTRSATDLTYRYSEGIPRMINVLADRALLIAYTSIRYPSTFSNIFERLSYIGYAMPPLAFALAWIFLSLHGFSLIYQTFWLLIVAYVLHFLAEAIGPMRSALLQIPNHLEEAARSLGLSKISTFIKILAPQILKHALPGLGNVWQITLKDTALISVTGLVEIMRQSRIAANVTHSPLTFYLSAAAVSYTHLTLPTILLV